MTNVNVLDVNKLCRYLEANQPDFKGPTVATKFWEGSQPHCQDRIIGGAICRCRNSRQFAQAAHAVDREYRVLEALSETDAVAEVYHLCTDPEVIGSMFYIMEYCDGNIHWSSALEALSQMSKGAIADENNRVPQPFIR